jgi:predicted lipoprotein
MKKKIYWIIAAVVIFGFILYNSVYVENLTERRARRNASSTGTIESVASAWKNGIAALLAQAMPVSEWTTSLFADTQSFVNQHGKSNSIGPFYTFILRGETVLTGVSEEELRFDSGNHLTGAIQIKYIFSNAVRDASGWFNLDEYENTMDYNIVSSEINQYILSEVVTDDVQALRPGDKISFYGVVEINRKELPSKRLEIIPLKIERYE